MNQIAQQGFDYGQLQAADANEVRAASERIKIRMKRTAEDIVAIGQDLIATKARLGHGQFGEWVKAEFEMTDRTAQALMQVADRFGKSEIISGLGMSPTILYQLAAPSTPDEVVARTIEAKEKGESVTNADVKRWKEEAQRNKEEAEQAKREKAEQESRVREFEAQQQDAAARLEKAREEYRRQQQEIERLKNMPPKEIEAPVPKPYISWAQYTQAQQNLMEDAQEMIKKAEREKEHARREVARINIEKMEAERARDAERNERSKLDDHNVHLTALRTSIAGFLRNNAEHFMAIDSEYLQKGDVDYLVRVEGHLREMADKIAEVRGISAEYAEFEVVSA